MNIRSSSRSFLEPRAQGQAPVNGRAIEPTIRDAECNPCANGLSMETPDLKDQKRPAADRVRILIADDNPIFRDGLRKLIESQAEMFVSGDSAVGSDAIELARELKPDLILVDLGFPERSGLKLLSELSRLSAPSRTLVMAATLEESSILEAFHRGARGIVLKSSPRAILLKSIRAVLAGQYWLDHAGLPIVIEALRSSPSFRCTSSRTLDYGLTPRELKIVGRVASGSSNKEVGQEFSISERTVKHHLTNIFSKLHLSGRVELAVFALEHGLVGR